MTDTAITTTANGGRILSFSSIDYASARAGAESLGAGAPVTGTVAMGQHYDGDEGSYELTYCYLEFDVSAFPDCQAAVLALFPTSDASVTDFTITAATYDFGAALTSGDWVAGASLSGLTKLATLTTAGLSTGAYVSMTETGTALEDAVTAAIGSTGIVRILIYSSRTENNNAPTGTERVVIGGNQDATAARRPRLTITHDGELIGGASPWLYRSFTTTLGAGFQRGAL